MLGESREKAMETSGHRLISVWNMVLFGWWRKHGVTCASIVGLGISGIKVLRLIATIVYQRKMGGKAKHTGGSMTLTAHFKKMVSLFGLLSFSLLFTFLAICCLLYGCYTNMLCLSFRRWRYCLESKGCANI